MHRAGTRICKYLQALQQETTPKRKAEAYASGLKTLRVSFLLLRSFCTPVKPNQKSNDGVPEDPRYLESNSEGFPKVKKQKAVRMKTNPDVFELKDSPLEYKVAVSKAMQSKFVMPFESALSKAKTRETFIGVLDTFVKNSHTRSGHVDLLVTAMKYMDIYGLEKDLIAYNAMLNVFPRGRFQNKTLFDAIWPKKQPQVDLALEILTKMEENVVKPSLDTYNMCEEIFGKASQPVQKCRRLAYWLTKLEEMFPNPLPAELPEGELELSKIALQRMTMDAIPLSVYQNETTTSQEFIVSSQSEEQQKILEHYDTDLPVYVEGPYFLWIRRLRRHFYTVRAHTQHSEEQDEGTILAVCMASPNCTQDMLQKWILELQEKTPNLTNINIIFNIQEPGTIAFRQ